MSEPIVHPALIAANLLSFGRRLREAGLPVGSGQILGLVEAVGAGDVGNERDVYHAARASVLTRPEQRPVFDREFARFWRELAGAQPKPLEGFAPTDAPNELALPEASRKRKQEA